MKTKITLRTLCQVAMLIALTFVLERFVPPINLPSIRLSFAFIPMMLCGMLFGPLWGAAAYGIADILGWPIMGLTPLPLILLSRILSGFIFGLVLHRDKPKFWPHAVVSTLTEQIICSAGLTTLALAGMTGMPYWAKLIERLPQFGIVIVLQLAVFPALVRISAALKKSGFVTV